MLILDYSSQFKKDFKKITKLPIPEIIEVGNVISTLQKGLILDSIYVDHALVGNWHRFRDCHIKPDLVLIYRIHETYLQLARISTHNDVFQYSKNITAAQRVMRGLLVGVFCQFQQIGGASVSVWRELRRLKQKLGVDTIIEKARISADDSKWHDFIIFLGVNTPQLAA